MKEVVCSSGVEVLADYLDGVLPTEVSTAVEHHVAGCPRCTAFVASYRATPEILRAATDVTMPTELESTLLAAVRRAMEQR